MAEGKQGPRTERRTSVTKLQRETAAAVELLALCQSITADGKLDEREVDELRTWLTTHRKTKLPACSFLLSTAERILRDGQVTAEERDELYRAIETAMPVDVRATMKAARASRDPSVDEEVRRARAERKRDEPLGYTEFFAKGVEDPKCVLVNTSQTSEGDRVFLRLEGKATDGTGIWAVCLENGEKVGNVPGDGDYFLQRQQSGELVEARVKRVFTGGRHPVPIIYVNFYRADADVSADLKERPTIATAASRPKSMISPPARPGRPPARPQAARRPAQRAGCAPALVVVIAVLIAAGLLR